MKSSTRFYTKSPMPWSVPITVTMPFGSECAWKSGQGRKVAAKPKCPKVGGERSAMLVAPISTNTAGPNASKAGSVGNVDRSGVG
jgi:hypothetical protein